MDIRCSRAGVEFVWDAAKALANEHRHGIRFEDAMSVFFDPRVRLVDASRNDESREAVIGLDGRLRLLFVVHVEIDHGFRLISARATTKTEAQLYEGDV